jgi:ATP-binding cassette, subfamily B, bacterial CvaB/MchF/RaxB
MIEGWLSSARSKPVLQTEAAECGLASLTMVARHHGHDVNLAGLRRRYPTSIQGATLPQLMAIATDLGMAPRAVRLELTDLGQLALPAVLHWDLNHFVVLESVGGNRAVVLDPASGRRIYTLDELSRHFTGVALELKPVTDFKPIQAKTTTRLTDLWSHISNFRSAFIQVLVLSLVLQFTTLLIPFYMQIIVDEAVTQADSNLLFLLFISFAVIYGLSDVTKALRDWVMMTLGQSLSFDLGGNVVRHLIRLPLPYFERRHVGDLLSRVGSIQPIQKLLTSGLVNMVIDLVLVLVTLVVMIMVSPMLATIVLVCTLLFIGVNQLVYPLMRRRSEQEIVARAGEATYLMESIRAIRAIKIHGHEAQRESGWRNQYASVISASYRSGMLGIGANLAETVLFDFAFLLCAFLGAGQVIDGKMSIGVLLAFLAYRSSFVGSATSLVDQVLRWRLLSVHLERLSDIVCEPREELTAHIRQAVLPGPAISLDTVSFRYDEAGPPILNRVSLEIPAGSLVALVGPSGAGKTTLMRLLLGLQPVTAGQILIDGRPLNAAMMAGWRARVGAVLQDDCLLTGTLADNIAFFDAEADQGRIIAAARYAGIDGDIARMPMAYETLIGDMGSSLSSGQRQRIFLARALYRDPDVLFLDEGTANLDPETELRIADMIAKLPMTRVVIAHRPALVERADYVISLADGVAQLRKNRAQ